MIRGVAFSPDGKYAVTASSDGAVQEWDVQAMKPHGDPIWVSPRCALAVAYSPDGSQIAIGFTEGVRQWDRRSKKMIGPAIEPNAACVDVTFSPDGHWILRAGGRQVSLWSATDGTLIHTLGRFDAAVFNRDGSRILGSIYSATDPAVCIWDSESGKELLRLPRDNTIPWAVAFSPDGSQFVTGTMNGLLRIWDTETGGAGEVVFAAP